MTERIVKRGGLSPTKRKEAYTALAEVGFLRDEYRTWKIKVDELDKAWEHQRNLQKEAVLNLENAKEQLSSAQEEIDADYLPEGAQPVKRIAKRDKLRILVSQLEAALNAQKQSTQRSFEELQVVEKKLFEADKKLNQFVDTLEDAQEAAAFQAEIDKERAARLAKLELKRVERWEKEQMEAIDARAAQVKELQAIASEQVKKAKQLNAGAVKTLTKATNKTKEVAQKIKEASDARLAERTEVVLELKTNVNAVRAEVATQAAKHVRKVEAAKKQLEDEKASYLAKGLNPYVEFRRREFEAQDKAREKNMKTAVDQNKADLAERLIKEEEDRRREDAIARKAKAYEKKHRDEGGRHLVEERNREFISSTMSGGQEVLDPTGRVLRVDPSQVTDIPDYSFGLGKSQRIPSDAMKRITEKIRQELNVDRDDLGEYQRLANHLMTPEERAAATAAATAGKKNLMASGKMKRSSSAGGRSTSNSSSNAETNAANASLDAAAAAAAAALAEEEAQAAKLAKQEADERRALEKKVAELREYASRTGSMPGASGAAIEVNLEGVDSQTQNLLKIAEEEAGGAISNSTDLVLDSERKYKTAELSKFEKDSFARAKERQRQRLEEGQEQIAGGKIFRGQSFVPKPAEVLFKDFEVGKHYKKVFTLTNASYTFNSFKILDLPDNVIDFFVITFEKPGRMSAGVSCSIEVAFNPQLNQDIMTHLSFLTETGPVKVPLTCLIKRCAPRILNPNIDFGSVIIGQKVNLALKMKNTEALSTSFKIVPVEDEVGKNMTLTNGEGMSSRPQTEGGEVMEGGDTVIASSSSIPGEQEIKPSDENVNASSNVATAVVPAPAAEEDNEIIVSENIGTEPAVSLGELAARVKRVMTAVLRRKQRENPIPLSFVAPSGFINGYDTAEVGMVCAPLTVGPIEKKYSLIFAGVKNSDKTVDEHGELITKEQIVTIRVNAKKVPIYVAEEIVDMRCTLHGRIYRKRLELRNRSKTAYRVNINIPSPYNKYIEVNPDMCFVQGTSSQIINVKFTPNVDILRRCAHFSVLHEDFQDAARVSIPIEIQVVNQELPAFFILQSDVTPSTVTLSTTVLDFGKIYVNQQSTMPLILKNISMLPQKLAFTRMRKEVTAQPNDGFVTLLPNEEFTFDVSFCPASAIDYNFEIVLLSSFNDKYPIRVIGQGVEAPIIFSETVIDMRSTCPGERVLESIIVQNKTQKQQCIEIMIPDKRFTWLRAAPTIVDLAPGAGQRVEFEFLPPPDCDQVEPDTWHQQLIETIKQEKESERENREKEKREGNNNIVTNVGSLSPRADESQNLSIFDEWEHRSGWMFGKGMYGSIQWVKTHANESEQLDDSQNQEAVAESKAGDDGNANQMTSPDGENQDEADIPINVPDREWGIVGSWRIPVCIRPRSRVTTSAIGSRPSSAILTEERPLFLTVQTVVTLPQIVCDNKYIDFGMLPVGSRQLRQFRIGNMSDEVLHLHSSGLSAYGPFTMITPMKELAPGEYKVITIECLPARAGLSIEILELQSNEDIGGHCLRITLRAQGVKPTISLEGLLPGPESWGPRCGILDFGNVVGTDVVKQKFTINNKSSFAVDAIITRAACAGLPPARQAELIEYTANGLPIFTIKPERVRIEQNTSQDIEIIFRPDRGRFLPFREDLLVAVGATDEILRVGLYGRAWNRQAIVFPANPRDESFFNANTSHPYATVEDLSVANSSYSVRKLALDNMKALTVTPPPLPPIMLEYPDPFREDADPASYVEGPAGGAAPPAKGAPAAAAAAAAAGGGAAVRRSQKKSLKVACCKINDSRAGAGNSTYEVVLSDAAKSSGLFSLTNDKGTVTPGGEMVVDITCSLPKPTGMGGLSVGSWQNFPCDVVIKEGWLPQGDVDEKRVAVILRAFVSL